MSNHTARRTWMHTCELSLRNSLYCQIPISNPLFYGSPVICRLFSLKVMSALRVSGIRLCDLILKEKTGTIL
jgi:hypothetical protein